MTLEHVAGNLYRGSYPKTKEDFTLMRSKGIATVISLQGNLIEFLGDEVVTELNAYEGRFHWLPLSSFWPPDRFYVGLAIKMIQTATKPILVHCEQGVDRTGYVIAAYQMQHCGYSFYFARATMILRGFHRWYFYWWPSLKAFWEKTTAAEIESKRR